MNNKLSWQQKPTLSKLLFTCVLILSLIVTNTAIAAYKPPTKPSRPSTPTGSNSTRTNGCTGTAQTTLTTLAPLAYIGQTVSVQPTFAWYVPDATSREMEFSLYEYTNGKAKVIYKTQMPSSSGIMSHSLPKEKISLAVGGKYVWQIVLLCNPNHPSEDLVAKAEIEVVAMSSDLTNALSRTKDPLKRSQLYAEQGLWYDALGETLNNPINKAPRLKLLEQLSKQEAEEVNKTPEEPRKKELQQQVLRLQQILAVER
jgi:Domain of Unknown Function (DUF928)